MLNVENQFADRLVRHDQDVHVVKLSFAMAIILNSFFFVGMFDKKLLLLKLESFT